MIHARAQLLIVACATLHGLVLPAFAQLPKTGWSVTADSEEPGANNQAARAIDDSTNTIWHTQWNTASPGYPHQITIDMGQTNVVDGLDYTPRQDGNANGYVGGFEVRLSTDGLTFGVPVVAGTWVNSNAVKSVTWTAASARFVRLIATSTASAGPWASAAEIDIRGTPGTAPARLESRGWTATADSEEPGANNQAARAIDDSTNTIWHTQWNTASPGYPHQITIDMGQTNVVDGLDYTPRQDGNVNGYVGGFEVRLSTDGLMFGAPVVAGTWVNSNAVKSVTWTAASARFVRLIATSTASGGPWASAAEIDILGTPSTAAPPPPPPANPVILSRTGFTAVASDENSVTEAASLVLDGNEGTLWHSTYSGGIVNLPHSVTVDFGGSRNIAGLAILPRQDGNPNGHIGRFSIAASTDGNTYVEVAMGTFANTRGEKTVTFDARAATSVRITALSEAGGPAQLTSIAEVNVLGYTGSIPDTQAATYGLWGPLINMPLVPVAAALLPDGKVCCSQHICI
jgi:galactose oxidase